MSYIHNRFELTALAAALMVMFGPAMAADDEDLNQITQPSSSVSVGVGAWSDDRPQFGMFDGMRDDGGYLLLDADINKRNAATGTWTTLKARNLGLDSREIGVEYNVQGNWGVTLDYSQTPREAPYTVNTALTGLGTTEQVRAPGTGIATGALSGTNVQLGTERQKTGLGLYKNLNYLMPGLEFKANFSNEEKKGNRHWGRGGSAEFAVEPIDYTTRHLETLLNYTGNKLQLSGGYIGSWFQNANDLVCSRTTAASCTGTFANNVSDPSFLSLPFDNQAHQAFITGAYRFSPTTQGTFKASYTRATVDESIPTASASTGPFTATSFTFINAPTHFDAEVNTTLVQLGLTARPMPKLNVVANVRYHDVDDNTPVYPLVGSNTTGIATTHGTPLSYETLSGKLEGIYSLSQGYSVIAGIDYSNQDRTVPVGQIVAGVDNERYVPFRAELDEITYRVQLRKSLSETLNGSIGYLRSDRDGSNFALGRNAAVDLIAPLHIADRVRDKIRLTADWAPTEALSVQLNIETAKDDYGMSAARPHGVHEGKANVYSLDLGYRLNENWQALAWYSHNTNDIYQLGVLENIGGGGTKDADQKDTGNAVGGGLTGKINAKTKLGVDLSWAKDESSITQRRWNTVGVPVAVTQVPDITSTATRIKLFGEYALRKNADLRIDLIHERWKSDDWTWTYSNGTAFQYGTTTDGTAVTVDPKQDATFVGVRYTHKFQ